MNILRRQFDRLAATTLEVPLAHCVHYCGFRYVRGTTNPYLKFAEDLLAGASTNAARANLVRFLRSYRPRTMQEALGIPLRRDYPVWQFPWKRVPRQGHAAGWVQRPSEVVDIMAWYSDAGIPSGLLDQECWWHDNARRNMEGEGYRPDRYGYVTVLELRGAQRSAYLVTDGNHRVSALAARGVTSLRVKRPYAHLHRLSDVRRWPSVRDGLVDADDAVAIAHAYFDGARPVLAGTSVAEVA